jgi:hypothetical protein
MEPPFPSCPSCGLRFGSAAIWRPRGDSRDVIVLFHDDTSACDKVFGTSAEDQGPPTWLGSLSDYRGDMTQIVSESHFVFDLTVSSKSAPDS